MNFQKSDVALAVLNRSTAVLGTLIDNEEFQAAKTVIQVIRDDLSALIQELSAEHEAAKALYKSTMKELENALANLKKTDEMITQLEDTAPVA